MRGGQTLCVLLLLSLTLQLAANNPCSRDIKQNVQSLMKSVTNQKCPKSTMRCFTEEAKVLEREWKNMTVRLVKKLKVITDDLNQPQLDCPECELHRENAVLKFLENLLGVLQAIYVDNCPSRPPAGG
uniref:Interleukin 15 variant IL-15x n=2 Tax=Tetraodon nigroviridis TaxID=99883 RepID=Q2Q501_TETNG|nr:interleukin 15 variant IL-15x [Tetraodon nigroviridis]